MRCCASVGKRLSPLSGACIRVLGSLSRNRSCLLAACASTRTQQIKWGVFFESRLRFLLVCARMLLCSLYLLNLLAFSPHLFRARYTCFKLQNSVVKHQLRGFASWPTSLIRSCPAACGSYTRCSSPRRRSRLFPDAQSWAHLHSAGCWVSVRYKVLPPKLWCIYYSSHST